MVRTASTRYPVSHQPLDKKWHNGECKACGVSLDDAKKMVNFVAEQMKLTGYVNEHARRTTKEGERKEEERRRPERHETKDKRDRDEERKSR